MSPEGFMIHELRWVMTQQGPNNQSVHHAVAESECHHDITLSTLARGLSLMIVRGVSLGEGTGVSKGHAKSVAAERALDYLNQNGLPE